MKPGSIRMVCVALLSYVIVTLYLMITTHECSRNHRYQVALNMISAMQPSWTIQDTAAHSRLHSDL